MRCHACTPAGSACKTLTWVGWKWPPRFCCGVLVSWLHDGMSALPSHYLLIIGRFCPPWSRQRERRRDRHGGQYDNAVLRLTRELQRFAVR